VQERAVRVIGADADREAVGRFLADGFRRIPGSEEAGYIDALVELCEEEGADCLIPASSYETNVVAAHLGRFEAIGVKVLVSELSALEVANDKFRLYDALRDAPSVRVPEFRLVKSLEEFLAAFRAMGGGERRLCFKPPYSKGSRGFRYIDDRTSRRDLLMNFKPDSKFISLAEFTDIFRSERDFPELLLMEVLEGEEIDSMVIGLDGEALLVTHKTREKERGGVITQGEIVERPEITRSIEEIVARIPLRYNFGIQFIGGALLEINPRLSTFLYTDEWVEPYFAIKLALGEYTPADIRALASKNPVGLRMRRYFDQCFFPAERSALVGAR
jgi:carbamoyl-phosphate synthase large subunit